MAKKKSPVIKNFRTKHSEELVNLLNQLWPLVAKLASKMLPVWCAESRLSAHSKTILFADFLRLSEQKFIFLYQSIDQKEQYDSRMIGTALDNVLNTYNITKRYDLFLNQLGEVGFLINEVLARLGYWTEEDKTQLVQIQSKYQDLWVAAVNIIDQNVKKENKNLLSRYVDAEYKKTVTILKNVKEVNPPAPPPVPETNAPTS